MEYSSVLSLGFTSLFVKYPEIEVSDMTVEEAIRIGEMMKRDAELGQAYLRGDYDVVIGRKPGLILGE